MIKEMDKCDVVCANCHAIRTDLRFDNSERLSARGFTKDRPVAVASHIGDLDEKRLKELARINSLVKSRQYNQAAGALLKFRAGPGDEILKVLGPPLPEKIKRKRVRHVPVAPYVDW